MNNREEHGFRPSRAERLGKLAGLLRCPICAGGMTAEESGSLVCPSRHCFDISKHGYINLLTRASGAKYGKTMFQSRRMLMASGFFAPLTELMAGRILKAAESMGPSARESVFLLDAGCGEGSHLTALTEQLRRRLNAEVSGVGLDIAKEGIVLAAKRDKQNFWLVADAAQPPLAEGTFHVILSIFSPSNYRSFHRLLRPEGAVIKVIPGPGHLRELRERLYANTEKAEYSNEQTRDLFRRRYGQIQSETLTYENALDRQRLEWLLDMTPLSWGAAPEQLQNVLHAGLDRVTVDVEILIGTDPLSL